MNHSSIRRLRTVSSDRTRAQLELERLLAATELHPPGLSASAILCVRWMRLPRPKPGLLRPPAGWEQSAQERLEYLARTAARPALGVVALQAEAVLFADQAELLVCLALDWLAGDLVSRWWWPSLYPGLHDLPLMAWQNAPEAIPAALEHLTRRGQALAFLRRIGSDSARRLRRAVQERYGLGEWLEPDWLSPEASPIPSANPPLGKPTPPRWQNWLPQTRLEDFELEPLLLWVLGLLLRRAPSVVRSAGLAGDLQRWIAEEIRSSRASPQTSLDTRSRPFRLEATDLPAVRSQPEETPLERTEPPPAPRVEPLPWDSSAAGSTRRDGLEPFVYPSASSSFEPSLESLAPPDVSAPEAEPWPRIVETEYGGLFFLLNLALALELYGDFSRPLEPGLSLSPWDLLALLGQTWSGEGRQSDPLWPLLAELAGRTPQEPPGAGFDPPDQWRLPLKWLVAFPEPAKCRWGVRRGRLLAQHPGGFLLLDVRRKGDLSGQWEHERKAYRSLELGWARAPLKSPRAGRLERWCAWLFPYLEARLQRALGIEKAGALVVRQPARVWMGASDLEVGFSLETHPLEIRLAGLDRDPGWIPAAGRTVRFRFE